MNHLYLWVLALPTVWAFHVLFYQTVLPPRFSWPLFSPHHFLPVSLFTFNASLYNWYAASSSCELARMRTQETNVLGSNRNDLGMFFPPLVFPQMQPHFDNALLLSSLAERDYKTELLQSAVRCRWVGKIYTKRQALLVLVEIVNYPFSKTALIILLCNALGCVSYEREAVS